MVSCKIYQTGEICEIIHFLEEPSGKRWVKISCRGVEKFLLANEIVPMSELSLPEKSSGAKATAPSGKTYIERPCTLSKSRFSYHFEMIDVKSGFLIIKSFLGISSWKSSCLKSVICRNVESICIFQHSIINIIIIDLISSFLIRS